MTKTGRIKRDTRREFLLTFFKEDKYAEKFVNGFWLIKSWDGGNDRWQVAIFTEESYKNYKLAGQANRELEDQQSFLDSI